MSLDLKDEEKKTMILLSRSLVQIKRIALQYRIIKRKKLVLERY